MYHRVRRSDDLTPIWVIIVINLIIFIATFAFPQLVALLGLQPAFVLDRPWTIITSMFTHAGLWHILANMLTFYFFGRFIIELVGSRNMLIVYFVGGIVGNIFYILLGSPYSIAIGASGAIFAIGGTLAVLRPKQRVIAFPIPVPMPLWLAIVIGFIILSVIPGIAWQAHLGGLVCGLIAGFILRKRAQGAFIA